MEMIEIDGKEMSMIEFIEKNIQQVVEKRSKEPSRVCGKKHENGFFYSEDDFQISLVRAFEKYYPGIKVFYELNRRDIVLELNGKEEYQIELKYSYVYDKYNSGTKLDDIIYYKLGMDIKFINDFFKDPNMEAGYFVLLAKRDDKLNILDLLKKHPCKIEGGKCNGIIEYGKSQKIVIKNPSLIKYDEIDNYQYLIMEILKNNLDVINK